jgi:hypothetical protein
LERIPPPDLHHDTRVHFFIDEKALSEPTAEIVAADVTEVVVIGCFRGCFGGPFDCCAEASFGQVNEWLPWGNVLGVLELLEVALNARRKEGVAGLAAVPTRILAFRDAKPVGPILGLFDVLWFYLWYLESSETNVRTELDDDVVSIASGRTPKVLDLLVGHPDLVFVFCFRRFQSHTDYCTFLRDVSSDSQK